MNRYTDWWAGASHDNANLEYPAVGDSMKEGGLITSLNAVWKLLPETALVHS